MKQNDTKLQKSDDNNVKQTPLEEFTEKKYSSSYPYTKWWGIGIIGLLLLLWLLWLLLWLWLWLLLHIFFVCVHFFLIKWLCVLLPPNSILF